MNRPSSRTDKLLQFLGSFVSKRRVKSLPDIKAEVDRLADIIGAKGHYALPTYGSTEHSARPRIEVDPRGYHFVVVERGGELERFTTLDLDDLLYRIFQSVTENLANDSEPAYRKLARRKQNQDAIKTRDRRRTRFQIQEELLAQLSKRWADRIAVEHERILRDHP